MKGQTKDRLPVALKDNEGLSLQLIRIFEIITDAVLPWYLQTIFIVLHKPIRYEIDLFASVFLFWTYANTHHSLYGKKNGERKMQMAWVLDDTEQIIVDMCA